MKNFVEKYKPRSSLEIPQQLDQLKKIIERKQHALIYGQTGTCKTISIHTIAKELDYEIVEVNASDFRTKDQIESIIGSASKQQSLFQKEKILIIDEVDCLSGMEDRGGAIAIVNVLKTSKFPIILTANDPYNDKIKEVKKLVTLIEFKPISELNIFKIIKTICEKENIKFSEEALKNITTNCNGDIRAAINDLQSNIENNELMINKETREYETNIMQVLNKIFKTKDINSNRILENAEIDLDEYLLWLDENLPIEYKDQDDLLKSYELLAKADVFKGRIHKWQHWRFMHYQSLLTSSGISIIKSKINQSFSNYKRSMRPLRIWQFNMKNSKKKTIADKLASYTHTSKREILRNFEVYKKIINNTIAIELKLDQEEIEFLEN